MLKKINKQDYDFHKDSFEKSGDISTLLRYGEAIKIIAAKKTILSDGQGDVVATPTTFILEFPRLILSQFNKHRAVVSNTSSTRAIPTMRVIDTFNDEKVYIPPYLFKNGAGMYTKSLVDYNLYSDWYDYELAKYEFNVTQTKKQLAILDDLKVHKQHFRALEPWQIVRVIATSFDWTNYYKLRDSCDVQPEFWFMANLQKNYIVNVERGQHHLPYSSDLSYFLQPDELKKITHFSEPVKYMLLLMCNVVKAAAISYYRVADKYTLQDIKRVIFNLLGDGKLHGTPFEHVLVTLDSNTLIPFEIEKRGFVNMRDIFTDDRLGVLKKAFLQTLAEIT